MRNYLISLGWTAEIAKERRDNSLKYAREAKDNNWNHSYVVLFVELAWKYHKYIKILAN